MRDLQSVYEGVDAVRKRLDAHRPFTPDVEERVDQWVVPRFVHASSALGSKDALTATQTAAFIESEIVSGGHPLDRFLAVRRHQAGLEAARERAREGGVIDVDFVRRLHVLLTEGSRDAPRQRPGLWKEAASRTTRRRGHVFRYVAPSKVEECMARLEREMPAWAAERHPLEVAAWLYFHLNMIHPFERLNGKVARLAATTVLLHAGYPPLIVPPEEIGGFLDALRACDASVTREKYAPLSAAFDLSRLIEFFAGCLSRTGERLLDVIEGRTAQPDGFAEGARASQVALADDLRRRQDVSWRFRATFEVRALHARIVSVLERMAVEGPLFTIRMERQDVLPTHAVARAIAPVLPTAEAGLVGEVEMIVEPQTTTRGIKFPPTSTLVVAVAATAIGMHVVTASSDLEEPQVHYGPNRSPEWPTSTLETILARTLDEQRKRFEGGIDKLNASPTQRFKLLRGRSGEVDDLAVLDAPAAAAAPSERPEESVAASARDRLTRESELDGVKPAEPPLLF